MRSFLQQAVVCVVVIPGWGVAGAQTTPKPLPAPQATTTISSRPLVMEPAVQKEIGLTDKQLGRLQQIESSASEANQAALNTPAMTEEGEEGFDFNAMMGNVEQNARQQQASVARLLSPAQKARLLQIEWQREGWLALGRTDVSKKIKLSAAQNQKIQAIIAKMRQTQFTNTSNSISTGTFTPPPGAAKNLNPANGFMDPTMTPAATNFPNFKDPNDPLQNQVSAEALTKLQTASQKDVDALLTAEQKTAFEQLLGPAFNFATLNQPVAEPKRSSQTPRTRKSGTKKAPKKP